MPAHPVGRPLASHGVEGVFCFCYSLCVQSVVLSYKLKLYPTQNKADTLALLSGLFRRLHTDCTLQMAGMEQPRIPSCKGKGEFVGRAYQVFDNPLPLAE